MHRDDPFAPWNDPCGREEDLCDYGRKNHINMERHSDHCRREAQRQRWEEEEREEEERRHSDHDQEEARWEEQREWEEQERQHEEEQFKVQLPAQEQPEHLDTERGD